MNRIDATPTSAPEGSWRSGTGPAADAEGLRFAWHPTSHDEPADRRRHAVPRRPDGAARR